MSPVRNVLRWQTHPMLLDGYVGEVDVHVVQFLYACVIFDSAETTETQPEQVALEGPEGCHQYVQS